MEMSVSGMHSPPFKSIAIEYCQKVALKVLQYQIQYWNLEILQYRQQYQKSIAITIAAIAILQY